MMLSLLLTLATAPALPAGATADHASLHPADALLYVALPDLQGVAGAYERAPLAQMLADPEVHKALAGFGIPTEGLSFDTLVQMALGSLGPRADLIRGALALSLSVRLGDGEPGPETMGLELVLDYATAETAAKAEGMLREQLGSEEDPTRLELPLGDTTVPGWVATEGGRLLVGGGTTSLEQVAPRLKESGGGLAADELYRGLVQKLPAGGGVVLLQGALRVAPSELGGGGRVPPALRPLMEGLQPFPGPTAFRTSFEGDRFVTRIFSATEREATVLGVKPVDRAWLDLVPPGAMFVYGGSLDARALAEMLQEAMGELGLSEDDAARAEAALPVFGKLGPDLVCYSQPLSGLGIPETHLWMRLAEPEGFQEELAAALTELLGVHGVEVSTRDYKVRDQNGERIPFPITSLKLPEGMMEGPLNVTPSFTVLDGKLLATLTSVHLKRELKRRVGGEEEEVAGGVDPLRAAGASIPEDARSVMAMDWSALIDGLFNLARTFGGLAAGFAGEGGLPFDVTKLPPSQVFTSHFRPTVHVARRVEGGLLRVHEASFGPETLGALLGAAFLGVQAQQAAMTVHPGEPIEIR